MVLRGLEFGLLDGAGRELWDNSLWYGEIRLAPDGSRAIAAESPWGPIQPISNGHSGRTLRCHYFRFHGTSD